MGGRLLQNGGERVQRLLLLLASWRNSNEVRQGGPDVRRRPGRRGRGRNGAGCGAGTWLGNGFLGLGRLNAEEQQRTGAAPAEGLGVVAKRVDQVGYHWIWEMAAAD